jgi:hypothetical protein
VAAGSLYVLLDPGLHLRMALGVLGVVLQHLDEGVLHAVGIVEPLDHEVLVRHFLALLSILDLELALGNCFAPQSAQKALTAYGPAQTSPEGRSFLYEVLHYGLSRSDTLTVGPHLLYLLRGDVPPRGARTH